MEGTIRVRFARRRVEGTSIGVRCCQSLTPQEEGGYIKSWGAPLPGGWWRVRPEGSAVARGVWRVRLEGCTVARRKVEGTGGNPVARVLHHRRTANTYRRMDPSV